LALKVGLRFAAEVRVMKLQVQPRDGLNALLSEIRLAKKEIDILIFRCDRQELLQALEAAVKRGVKVRTLIAHTNRGGEKALRKLEQRLLDGGITVARTGDEFVRYHGKMMVVDRRTLWVLGYNFAGLDLRSRSFGIVTRTKADVQQALKLFEADMIRQPYAAAGRGLVVSPESARALLADFIGKARKQLLIYDLKVSDPAMVKLLKERMKKGVDVRIIGKVDKSANEIPHDKYPGKRLHVRAMVRDGQVAFVGSQSLRSLELDKRREVGLIVRNAAIVGEIARTFEEDWALTDTAKRLQKEAQKSEAIEAERPRERQAATA
jgi:cardiolipin synthase